VSAIDPTKSMPPAVGRPRLRTPCKPPRAGKTRWCGALEAILNATDTRGVFQYDGYSFKTGKFSTLGVAAREGMKPKGAPILFNHCPFCGEKIFFGPGASK